MIGYVLRVNYPNAAQIQIQARTRAEVKTWIETLTADNPEAGFSVTENFYDGDPVDGVIMETDNITEDFLAEAESQ